MKIPEMPGSPADVYNCKGGGVMFGPEGYADVFRREGQLKQIPEEEAQKLIQKGAAITMGGASEDSEQEMRRKDEEKKKKEHLEGAQRAADQADGKKAADKAAADKDDDKAHAGGAPHKGGR